MTERLDVLFINPSGRTEVYQSLANELAAVEPPIWAGKLAASARQRGYSVGIVDAEAEGLTPGDVADRVAATDPVLSVVVVYGQQPSASTQNMPAAGRTCRAIKALSPDFRILMLGGHVSALPKRTLLDEETDFVCQGEGPHTISRLVDYLKRGTPSLGEVPGLWYRDAHQGIVASMPAPLIRDVDAEYPGIAWDLLPMERYRAHNWHCFDRIDRRQPYASLYTTLGCPYRCTFCCINAPFKMSSEGPNSYRFHGVEHVLDELTLLQQHYGVSNIKIADEMFVLNERHVLGICNGIAERGLDLNIWAYARVDTVKDGFLEPLKRAGVNWLALGIESASKHVRDGVEKGRFGSEQITRVVRSIQAAGINVIGNFIFGLPDDDLDSMRATLDLALSLKCEMSNFYSAMAYPGSRLYDMAVEQRWELPKSWAGFSQHGRSTLPLPTEFVSAGEVLGFRDYAFQRYFTDTAYLGQVRATFGEATEAHIREMASHTLDREHAIPPREVGRLRSA